MFETEATATGGGRRRGLDGLAAEIARLSSSQRRDAEADEPKELPAPPPALMVPASVDMSGPGIGGTAAQLVGQASAAKDGQLEESDFPAEEISVWRRRAGRAAAVCDSVSTAQGAVLRVQGPIGGDGAGDGSEQTPA